MPPRFVFFLVEWRGFSEAGSPQEDATMRLGEEKTTFGATKKCDGGVWFWS